MCLDDASEDQKEEFLQEIEQMKLLGAHQNIVSLVGCCTLQEHKFLVIEYVPFGDLLQWLRRRRRSVRRFIKEYLKNRPFPSSLLRLFQRESFYENDLDLHGKETACRTHFHMKGFAFRLVLKQRYKRTREWPI